MLKGHLFVPTKLEYAKGVRPDVQCILCEVVARRDTVTRLEIWREGGFLVSANLHPYNPGHMMVFPERHIEDPAELSSDELLGLFDLQQRCMKHLEHLYDATGFNVGFNMGDPSGASIAHFHVHIVPRYPSELGFVDIIGGARICVEDPNETCRKLKEAFAEAHRASSVSLKEVTVDDHS